MLVLNAQESFLNIRVCSFSSSYVIANEESLSFGLLVGRKMQFKDLILVSEHFSNVLILYGHNDYLISCDNSRQIKDDENHRLLQPC